jgi:D-alanyl-D-alanine endopeptidase (penicillin-binding protein 7)
MKNALVMLLAAAMVGTGAAPAKAEAGEKKKSVAAKKKVSRVAVQLKPENKVRAKSPQRQASLDDTHDLALKSAAVLVQDQATGTILFEKNASAVLPIASITKLMTAMVVLDAVPDLNETLTIGEDDVDIIKGTRSRLRVGTQLVREEMLRLALMSSENRAASALARHYPGGREAFVAAMNRKAQALGLADTRFHDPTGLTAANVSSPRDLAKMVDAAHQYPLIREFSTAIRRRVQHRRSPAAIPQHQHPGQESVVGDRPVQDRLHQRGRQVPGDAGLAQQQADDHRAARLLGQDDACR